MNDRLTETQQKLIINNYGLLISYISKNIQTVPGYLEQDFISDTFLKFCVSALKFDERTGFQFSTYAHGGFSLSMREILGRKSKKARRTCSLEEVPRDVLEQREFYLEINLLDDFIDEAELTLQEKTIVQDYYYNKISYRKLAKEYDVSAETIRTITNRALEKMRLFAKTRDLSFEDFYK